MAAMADVQRLGFDERIQRIQTGGPNTSGTIYIGPQEGGGPSKKEKRRLKKRMRARSAKTRSLDAPSPLVVVLSWPFAFLIGAICMLAGRVAAYQLSLQPDVLPPEWASLIMLTADVGIAALLLIVFGWAFSLGGGLRRIMLFAGFLAMMLGESMIMRGAPEAFAGLFSEEYVAAATATPAPLETLPQTWETISGSQVMLRSDLLPGVGAPAPTVPDFAPNAPASVSPIFFPGG